MTTPVCQVSGSYISATSDVMFLKLCTLLFCHHTNISTNFQEKILMGVVRATPQSLKTPKMPYVSTQKEPREV